ncbi:hypothetical protein [Acetobacterium woodii]|uniref:Uncharacterized protein n=1 Tax=Acetobacterium woodii (strain ATCC 29683 / DSM 1030 / JCM 2381 / KCTC 1655 / WB1) TaxID=931626 RepID=H6LDG8_ACEWD|nr:hypothetical protein [Acetobacterium woodii]AFA47940.1 hypothetical protein Awo_c11560 [Acetobacterium woodii DSM 1030]
MQAEIENEVIGYVAGKAIIRDEDGRWFFLEIPEALVFPGEQIQSTDLTPLEVLPEIEQKLVLAEMEVK